MKNSFNLGFIVLVLVVLGCSCPKLDELKKGGDTSAPSSSPSSGSNNSTATNPANSSLSSSNAGLSMDKYNQIKENMEKSEVEAIIGSPGEEISSSSGGGYTFSSYKWTGENYSTIIVIFQNNKVSSKSQFGLK